MEPIYLIIDTNIWIYMTNGEIRDSVGKRVHLDLFKILKELVENGEVVVLICPIVLEEFNRNKEWTQKYIHILESQILEKNNYLKNRKKNISDEERNNVRDEITLLETKREINKQHVSDIEDFIRNKTVLIPIPDSVKTQCFDQALAKKAPFTGKKSNSMADMAILLSAIDYIGNTLTSVLFDNLIIRPHSIFISGNITDFSQDKKSNKDKIHPDLLPYLSSVEMEYSISLGAILNSISDVKISQEEIDEMDDYLTYDLIPCPNCSGWHDGMGILDYRSLATLEDENIPLPIPKEQLVIPFEFKDEEIKNLKPRPQRKSFIELLQCNWCHSQFFECPVCGEMIMYDDEVQCDSCETKFECFDEFDRKGFLTKQIIRILAID